MKKNDLQHEFIAIEHMNFNAQPAKRLVRKLASEVLVDRFNKQTTHGRSATIDLCESSLDITKLN